MWSRSDRYFAATVALALLALVTSFVAVGAGLVAISDDDDGAETAVEAGAETIEITLGDLFVEPSSIEVPAGTALTLVVTNEGATVFDTLFKEGAYHLRPDAGRGGAQALDLQPAQGGFVEFTFDEDGLYPIVTHKFSNVGKGALGLFQAGEVTSTGAGH